MLKDKIKIQLDYLKKYPEIKVLGCLATYLTSGGKVYGVSVNRLKNHNSCFELTNKGKNIGTPPSGVIMETEIIKKIGGLRGEFWPVDDTDLWNRVSENGFIVYALPKILIKYRIHSDAFTSNNFIEGRIKNEWMNKCLNLRLESKTEIAFRKYKEIFKSKSFFLKFNFIQKHIRYVFRKSVEYLVNKQFFVFIYYLL